ncbi:hypothetical protein [Thalassospira sp. ER-Se-21-Dark]|uniref:4'-phosphopantetheinyl transferase family protein n=1 Tax=Thalassospira sp. ER-Se-21-Dark TaxID=2585190 RepID=UPI001B318248|nr:hypothetical protein [Thalassospira sp. ER-Se-21-Dark]MBP3126502.1 hypothetical protein [Thalassospira sp. ER-Se-21-Dark]
MNHSTKTWPSDENFPSVPVHVAGNGSVLWSILRLEHGANESRRAQRLRSSNTAQSMLRNLAQVHLGPSQAFEVSKEPSGRPVVRLSDKALMASISHSRYLVCVALGCDEQIAVGIDVEFHEPGRNIESMIQSLGWADVGLSPEAFYNAWCLYEARFKATGIVARNEQPEMCISALAVAAQYSGMLVWASKTIDSLIS